jgi:hypothetical protein
MRYVSSSVYNELWLRPVRFIDMRLSFKRPVIPDKNAIL